MSEPYFHCPFCGEDDFDKLGLKLHITRGHCEEFERIGSEEVDKFLGGGA